MPTGRAGDDPPPERTSPRDYRPIARELLRHRDEITAAIKRRDEQNVADRDQAEAAAREAQEASRETIRALGSIGIEARQLSPELDERSLAWGLAVSGAISRRIPAHRQCPHAKPGARRPLVALLTSRLLFCSECRPRFARRFGLGDDDGRCDVCDEPTVASDFAEFQITVGALQISGNACGKCRYWSGAQSIS